MQTMNDYIRPRGYYDNPGTKLTVTFETLNKLSGLTATASEINAFGSSIADLEAADEQGNGFYSDLAIWYGNTKSIATMETDETWTLVAGTLSADTTYVKVGSQGQRITENDNTGSALYAKRDSVTYDLTTLNNGEVSGTDDYIVYAVYISDVTKVVSFAIQFGADSVFSPTNRFYKSTSTGLVTGWNFIKTAKSAFTQNGAISWDDIRSMVIYWTSLDNALGAYVTFDDIWLCKKDPGSAVPNPFQRFVSGAWTRDFAAISGEWFVGLEHNELIWRNLNPADSGSSAVSLSLVGTKPYSDFVIYAKQKIKAADNTSRIGWQISAGNCIAVVVSAGNLYLYTVVNGTNNTSTNTPYTCAVGDIIEFALERSGNGATLKVYKNGDYNNPTTLSKTVLFSETGYLAIGQYLTNYTDILSFSITATKHAHHADIAENAKTLIMKAKATAFATAELKFGEFGYDYGDSRIYTVNTSGVLQYWSLT